MPWLRVLFCCALAQAFAAQDLDGDLKNADLKKEDILLARVRYHMAQTLQRFPNYTCTQTIERMERRAPSKRIKLIDVVRVEVALVNRRELYKWPGSGEFQEIELSDLVTGGAIGTGQFAGYAQSVFITNIARYTYAGEEVRDGKRFVRWNFVVPQNLSGYTLRVPPLGEAIVGYHGSFWVDRDTLDLKRLEVHADDIPPHLRLASSGTAVEYRRLQIGTGDFLLPSMSELQMVDLKGGASINRASFDGCRQYSGQSVISFEDPAELSSAAATAVRTLDAPAGLVLDLALETPIRQNTIAVGDPITFMLKKDVKLGQGLIMPKGTKGQGRVSFLRQHTFGRHAGFIVAFELTEFQFDNTRVRVDASLEQVGSASVGSGFNPWTAQFYVFREGSLGEYVSTGNSVPRSALYTKGYKLLLDKGLKMYWRTRATDAEDRQ